MQPGRVVALTLVLLLAATVPFAPTSVGIGVDDPHLRLGKVEPGFKGAFTRNVTNTADTTVQVDIRVTCPCPVYITTSPTRFELAPGERRALEIQVDVPLDADPGAHDTQIQVTERAPTSTGGTAVASATITAFFQVRAATLFLNPPSGTTSVPARFVNAYTETLDVTINGTVKGHGVQREVGPVQLRAPGSATGARVTSLLVELPLQEDDPVGPYDVTLWTSYQNTTNGTSGTSGPHTIQVAHGSLVSMETFQAQAGPNGLQLEAAVRSHAPRPLHVWLVALLTPDDGDAPITVTGPETALPAGGNTTLRHLWPATEAGAFVLTAHIAYRDGATEARSSSWPPRSIELVATDQASDEEDGADDPGPVDLDGQDPTLLALVALVGIGIGATVAILVNRRKA